MTYSIIFRPEAAAEMIEAYRWYEKRQPGLGAEFDSAVDRCLSTIVDNPLAFPLVHKQLRRMPVRRFPYIILYLLENNTIVVVSCYHARRNPANWKKRV